MLHPGAPQPSQYSIISLVDWRALFLRFCIFLSPRIARILRIWMGLTSFVLVEFVPRHSGSSTFVDSFSKLNRRLPKPHGPQGGGQVCGENGRPSERPSTPSAKLRASKLRASSRWARHGGRRRTADADAWPPCSAIGNPPTTYDLRPAKPQAATFGNIWPQRLLADWGRGETCGVVSSLAAGPYAQFWHRNRPGGCCE